MSIFGKIMGVIFILWSIVVFSLMRASGDIYAFMRINFITVFMGYIIIINCYNSSKKDSCNNVIEWQ